MNTDCLGHLHHAGEVLCHTDLDLEQEFIKLVAEMLVEASFNEYENLAKERKFENEEAGDPLPSV